MKGQLVNEQYQASTRRRLKERQAAHERDVKDLLALPVGRRFMWWLIYELGGLQDDSFIDGNPQGMAYREGRRSVARDVLREGQQLAPEQYLSMVAERMAVLANEDRAHAAELTRANEENDG